MLPICPPTRPIKPRFDLMHESESPRSLDDALPNSLDAALSVSADGGLPFDDGLVFYFEVISSFPGIIASPFR
jgi:hypothetical protein